MKNIEIWADSFHEGVWCCENISSYLKYKGYTIKREYLRGFIPHYVVSKNDTTFLDLVVYGSYKSWTPMPAQIKELIEWGKPDFIAFDSSQNKILFAVEETAATPTGNQAMQRCERQYGSAHLKVPYWYFVSEYGEHVDGGVRRDNIWPSIAAIKLSIIQKIPCIVLHYSDIDNVENYNAGSGLKLLFSSLGKIIVNYMNSTEEFNGLENLLAQQYSEMMQFIVSQWQNVIDFIPSINLLQDPNTAYSIARFALGTNTNEDESIKDNLLVWPKTNQIPEDILKQQMGKDLIKHDKLAFLLEKDVTENKCYILSNNAGSGKPTKREKIESWINLQKRLYSKKAIPNGDSEFLMSIEDFPETNSGNHHITTSKNIVYLYDKWSDLRKSIESAYPRLKNKLNNIDDNKPVFLYLSNSLKPGRLFGDPYTGQLAAYSTCFGKFDLDSRAVIAYFPHQSHSQAFAPNGRIIKNKGTTLYTELTDYMIFHSGIAVSLKDGEIV